MDDLDYNLNDELPDGRRVKRFYALQDMFGSYFHEDWRLDHPSTAAVIRRDAHDYPGRIPKVIAEIDELVALDASDEMLFDHLLHRYHLAYDPASDLADGFARIETVAPWADAFATPASPGKRRGVGLAAARPPRRTSCITSRHSAANQVT